MNINRRKSTPFYRETNINEAGPGRHHPVALRTEKAAARKFVCMLTRSFSPRVPAAAPQRVASTIIPRCFVSLPRPFKTHTQSIFHGVRWEKSPTTPSRSPVFRDFSPFVALPRLRKRELRPMNYLAAFLSHRLPSLFEG